MTRLLKTILPIILCALFGLSFASPTQAVASLPIVLPALTCDALSATDFSAAVGAKVTINHTEMQTSAQGSWCKVSATIAPEIGVQIALPTQRWSQRFLQVGCGGLCGSINLSLSNASGCLPAMNGEFVVAATDMGHHGSMMDASWAEDPQKRIDFAWRANHLTAVLAKAVMQTLYRQPPKYAYFMGCSDGGREALMEAQRFPQDFDGISAGAPAAFFQFQNSFFHGWNVAANQRPDGTAILLKNRLPLIHQAVLAHCPTLSGVQDGILQNPYACQFSESWLPPLSCRCSGSFYLPDAGRDRGGEKALPRRLRQPRRPVRRGRSAAGFRATLAGARDADRPLNVGNDGTTGSAIRAPARRKTEDPIDAGFSA